MSEEYPQPFSAAPLTEDPPTAADAGRQVMDVAKDQVANVSGEAATQTKDLLAQARTELTEQSGQQLRRLADGLRGIGAELQSMAHDSERNGAVTDLARQASTRSHDVAAWLDEREPGQLVDDLKLFARRRPGAFLLLAAGAGLVAGRLTRGLKESSTDDTATAAGSPVPGGAP